MKRWSGRHIARIISDFTAPPVLAVPLFTLLSVYDQNHSGGGDGLDLLTRLFFSITFGVTIPTVFIIFLFSRRKVTDLHISVRQQRNVPYLITIISYFVGFGLIYGIIGPGVLAAVMLSSAINNTVLALINLYWKISAHAIGISTPLTILSLLFGWLILPLFIFVPVVNWARVQLKAHTLGQVTAGSLLGFGLTFVQLYFIFRPLGWF